MLRVITLVRFRAGLPPAEAFAAWQTHTDTWDRRDHPEIASTRLVRFANRSDTGFDGFAETVWPDHSTFQRAAEWYGEPVSHRHAADLARFLDMDLARTTVIEEDSVIGGGADADGGGDVD